MIDTLLKLAGRQNEDERKAKLYRDLLKHEAKIGGELFGPVPNGGRREFFCLDEFTWIWYEEWLDKKKQRQMRTTRYEVRPGGITKIQDGQSYQQLSDSEAIRFVEAVKAYERRVQNELYKAVS
ncbi:MAG: hypothetical protein ACR2FM_03175 [Candidatus Saccharimonadales bacterium]